MIRKITSYLPLLGLLFLVATLPFPFGPMQRLALYVSAIGFVLDYVVNQRWQTCRWTKEKWIYVAFIAFFALTPIRQLFDSQLTSYYKFEIEHYMPFLIFGVVGILGMNNRLKVRYFAYVMLLVCLGIFAYVLYHVGFTTFFESANRILIFNTIRREINSHMVINLYCNTALICGGYALLQHNITKTERILTALACAFVFLFTMLSEGRVGVATTNMLLILWVVYACWKYQRRLLLPLLILCMGVSGYFLSTHERLQQKKITHDPRITIWTFSWEMIKEKPIFGYGVSTYEVEYLKRAYESQSMRENFIEPTSKYPKFVEVMRTVNGIHPHNAFLKVWLELGILGPVLLLVMLLLPFLLLNKSKRFFVGLFMLIYFSQCMFEPMGIHIPVTLFVLILLVFHYSPNAEGNASPAIQPLANA